MQTRVAEIRMISMLLALIRSSMRAFVDFGFAVLQPVPFYALIKTQKLLEASKPVLSALKRKYA